MDILKVGNISKYNENYIDFKVDDKNYLVNRESINTICSKYYYSDDETDIYKVEVETNSYIFVILTHSPDELTEFLLSGNKLSFDYYCKDTQRLIRQAIGQTNDDRCT